MRNAYTREIIRKIVFVPSRLQEWKWRHFYFFNKNYDKNTKSLNALLDKRTLNFDQIESSEMSQM